VDYIHIDIESDQWWSQVSMVMTLRVAQKKENCLTTYAITTVSRWLCSTVN